jgi:hypothetical protein
MTTTKTRSIETRLIGQQLCSVLTAIDYITLKFVKYPLTSEGEFFDSALVDIEEGFELVDNHNVFAVRKNDDLVEFRNGGAKLIALIGQTVMDVKYRANGELELYFNNCVNIRLLLNLHGFDSFDLTFQN